MRIHQPDRFFVSSERCVTKEKRQGRAAGTTLPSVDPGELVAPRFSQKRDN